MIIQVTLYIPVYTESFFLIFTDKVPSTPVTLCLVNSQTPIMKIAETKIPMKKTITEFVSLKK